MPWKGDPLEIIPFRPDEEPLICVSFNRHWLPFIHAALYPSRYPEAWLGTLEENRQARQDVLLLIDTIFQEVDCMSGCGCCEELTLIVLHQVNTITLQMEISIDGGITWTPDPQSPANQITQQPAPVTSGMSATKCDAATNGKQHMEDWIAGVSTAFDTYGTFFEWAVQVVLVLVGIILWILSAGALTAAEIAIIEAIAGALHQVFSSGKVAWDNFWTSDERDVILCAFACNISNDGTFDAAGYEGVFTYIRQNMSEGAQKVLFLAMLGVIGRTGLNNACSYGESAEADCGGCDCSSCFEGWTAAMSTTPEPVTGTDERGDYLQWTSVEDGLNQRVRVSNDGNWPSLNFGADCCVPGALRFAFFITGTETPATASAYGFNCGDSNITHFGAPENVPWWGVEVLGNLAQGAYDLRLYL
jgi:hypothetical protein